MNKGIKTLRKVTLAIGMFLCSFAFSFAQSNVITPWTAAQLEAPAQLASVLKNAKEAQPIIVSIGPAALIPGSVGMGSVSIAENRTKFIAFLNKLDKDKAIVIYCGCCPFADCPNVRPAFLLLKEKGFKNAKLLNLAQNIKIDWIDKGYPTVE